ncbi:STAS domain-containing protein [Nocardiopsis sp. RSe5-2]|uniref:Anti-sigma factor antagonist n=1 Tax=Nocardiopsis endophytica TaxID=3018445 RepID=A0ABT4TXA2_9ACTN|nr:STAS domain-containing protein [Nocardiopsis endophytica]MDA2809318.1 STAS domain-containing protein [Nocardiopsis endophytica]
MTGIDIDVCPDEGAVRLSIRGELDLVGAAEARGTACGAERRAGPLLVVDLTGLDFIDSSGLALLVELERRRRARGGRMAVRVAGSGRPARVLGCSGLDQVLDVRVIGS